MATITKLAASNFKILKAIDINFDGEGVVQLSGENAQGKSTVLDAIFAALGGAKALPDKPIRRGQKRADIEVHLDDPKVVVKRSFTAEGGTSLTVTAADGAAISSPQRLLDDLLGKYAFDPLAFSRLKPKERVDILLAIVDLKADPKKLDELAPGSTIPAPIERLDARYKSIYEERTITNRIVDQIKGELAPLPEESPDDPTAGVNVSDLVKQRDALNAKVAVQETTKRNAEQLAARAAVLRAELAKIDSDLAEAAAAMKSFDDHAPAIEALDEKIESAEGINERWNQVLRRREIAERLRAQEADSAKKTQQLEDVLAYKAELASNAKMPVEGLGFTDGDVTFKDVPFAQASQAEQIRISTAIGMARHPKLRLMAIEDGSLLSEKSLALLAEIAERERFTILVETVDTTGKVGIFIEDGTVAADNRPAKPFDDREVVEKTYDGAEDDSCPF